MELGLRTQSKNEVGRDLAGRDINNTQITLKYQRDGTRVAPLARLTERFKAEREEDKNFRETIDRLEHYSTPIHNETVVGLEAKLNAAGYQSKLDFAIQTKELFFKKLLKHSLSETAQRIHAQLLAEVYSRFHNCIAPLIEEGVALAVLNQAIQLHIIEPIQDMLEENVLELYADDINGMLYFLTGNCHIK